MSVDLKDRATFEAEHDPRPVVALPRPALSGAVIGAVALAAALLLFLALDAQRRQAPTGEQEVASAAFAPPPPLVVAPDPLPQAATVVRPATTLIAPRVLAPESPRPPVSPPIVAPPPPPPPPPEPYYRPLPPPRSVPLGPPPAARSAPALVVDTGSSGIAVGTLIPAVLETPIDTSRPGLARAIVSEDVRAQGSRRVLVPRGSRLIGEYQSAVRSGQNRVLVNWTQLIRPDGLTIRMASPAADSMGGAGIPGRVNGFFLSRFFNAALQTALNVGGNLVSRRGGNTVIVGVPGDASNLVAAQDLISGDNNRRKITVRQGTVFNVFVARELDLSGAATQLPGSATQPPTPVASAPQQ
ncbi:TrbI/VirB10 family protein [Sphingomonas sp. GCM10030256]|uniref:TrbI/VirB10 family protein n=1 Tax=Sphingomonas sp. GCM10030256 TaxID=3273427 RepID=UPI003622DD9D